MTNSVTTGRTVGKWVVALLAGALAATALLVAALGGAAGAQETRSAELTIDKTVFPKAVQVGERQVFTIRITNGGTTRAEAVRMRDPLPSKVRFIRASTSRQVPGSCGLVDRVVVCRLGTLRVDETVTVKIYVRPVAAGSYTNRAFASFENRAALERGASEASDTARATVVRAGGE